MTSSDFDSLIRSYGKWLSDNTTYTQLDEWYEVNVPLLDEDNDYTQFYVKPGKNSVTFSDDCATLRRLESHGMTVTESRLAVLKDILNQFGIERNGDELTLTSDTADLLMPRIGSCKLSSKLVICLCWPIPCADVFCR